MPSLRASALRPLLRTTHRAYTTQPPKEPSRAGTFYKSFSAPVLKCFLGALFTYQLAYYGWMKLEAFEEAFDKKKEVEGLVGELREAVVAKEREGGKVNEEAEGKKEAGGKRGWWGS